MQWWRTRACNCVGPIIKFAAIADDDIYEVFWDMDNWTSLPQFSGGSSSLALAILCRDAC